MRVLHVLVAGTVFMALALLAEGRTQDRSIFVNYLDSPSVGNSTGDVPCADGSSCPDAETCCAADVGFGCCPYTNAICCKDHQHCCPKGYKCDVKHSSCLKESRRTYSIPFTGIKRKSDPKVSCPDGSSCLKGDTCCLVPSGRYGCCPYEKAMCCSDKVHCCPQNTQCDIDENRCRFPPHGFLSVIKSTTMYNIELGKMEEPRNTCRNGQMCGSNCCSEGYFCESSTSTCVQIERFHPRGEYAVQMLMNPLEKIVVPEIMDNEIIIEDESIQCEKDPKCGGPCCPASDGSVRCCPFIMGVCCPQEMDMCCPASTVACASGGLCVVTSRYSFIRNIKIPFRGARLLP